MLIPALKRFIFKLSLDCSPNYAPLRDTADSNQPPINVIQLLADKAYDARRIAEHSQDPEQIQKLESFVNLYPILSSLSQRSLIERIKIHGVYQWKQFQRYLKAK